MVEFGLFFLIFLALAVGLMEMGRAVWTYTTLSHAVRAGARHAIVHGNLNPIGDGDTTIEDVVKLNAVGIDQNDITVTTSFDTTNERGNIVQVRIAYPFRLVSGGLLVSQATIQMASTSRMVILN